MQRVARKLNLHGHNIPTKRLPRHPRNSPGGPKMDPRRPQRALQNVKSDSFDPPGGPDPPPWVYPKRAATILEPSWPLSWVILGPLGPSSAYLGPLLQPTCSSTSLLGTLMPKLTAHKIQLARFADCFDIETDMPRQRCCQLLLCLKLQRPIFEALCHHPSTPENWIRTRMSLHELAIDMTS